MKLRDRLLVFSTAQLVVFGALFGVAYGSFEHAVLPMLEDMLRAKSEGAVHALGGALDVPLGAADHDLMEAAVARTVADPDFGSLVVRDLHDRVVLSHGSAPPEAAFAGPADVPDVGGGQIRAWTTIVFEGLRLGTVSVTFRTARYDAVNRWATRIAADILLIWLAALAYSVIFARSFVSPIRAMMVFSRKVAGGALSERLERSAPGELRELCDDLNEMTADLERRELERKASAAHAENLQRELVTVSRMAGMAEIATGVLHNVGNVLNSLNVSVSMIGDQLRTSRVAGLTQSLALVEQFPGGLPAFLRTEKGKILPTYLGSVSRRLSEENAKVLEELGSVARHVDHIKAIVAMQQSYAQPSGVMGPVVIGALIDDALHMGESSFARHGIEVIKDYDRQLTIVTDRHKVLQIMINLIANARHALKERRLPPQRLAVQVRRCDDRIAIRVSDTGIGIPAANLDRIFGHGFTTRPTGHGFGLHASANAARELGGTLRAASDGPGRGASFTLELPAAVAEGGHALAN
ncbi:MAG: ATP-binding protein [Kofleriaceae bacterium]